MTARVEVDWAAGAPLVDDAAVARAARRALAHGGRPGLWLAVVVVDDPTLARMHDEHLGDPSPTDVIAFDLGEEGEGPAGELYVSADRARAEAERRGVPLERELLLYVVHGALHLCGLDDRDDAGRAAMRAAEREVLGGLGLPPDPTPHDA